MPDFSPETANFISELDAAVDEHMDWARRVLRCAVLREPPGGDVLAPLAHNFCRFGRWFERNKACFGQLDTHNTRLLETAHQTMHDAIRSICIDLLAGRLGQSADLEVFEQAQGEMIKLIGKFKTQFIAAAARCDHLTGLPLRHGIENDFELLRRMAKRDRFLLYVMMIDIDHFKAVNDTYGHRIGDLALCHLAEVLKRIKRDNEPLYRFGGEEFLLLMQSPSPEGIARTAQRFIDAVRNTPVLIPQGQSVALTISLGVSRVGEDEDLASAVERADQALYAGKRAGRDCYVIADD